MYMPTLGRWISKDPLPEKGEPEVLYTHEYVAQRMRAILQPYTYVENLPTRHIDPSGLQPGFKDYWCCKFENIRGEIVYKTYGTDKTRNKAEAIAGCKKKLGDSRYILVFAEIVSANADCRKHKPAPPVPPRRINLPTNVGGCEGVCIRGRGVHFDEEDCNVTNVVNNPNNNPLCPTLTTDNACSRLLERLNGFERRFPNGWISSLCGNCDCDTENGQFQNDSRQEVVFNNTVVGQSAPVIGVCSYTLTGRIVGNVTGRFGVFGCTPNEC